MSSTTPASNAFDEFELIDADEVDAAALHEQYVCAMAHHEVPPYPIYPAHARLEDIVNQPSRQAQLRRYELCMRVEYKGNKHGEMNAVIKRFPRREMKIVHMLGETLEVLKHDRISVCDDTCPARKGEGWLKKFARDLSKIEFLDRDSKG